MNKNLKTRAEKIKLLSDLSSGKITIKDILPTKVEIWTSRNGIVKNETNQKELSKGEFELYKRKAEEKQILIFYTELAAV